MQFASVNSISPSFTANSSNNLADIAARVVEEFRNETGHDDYEDDIYNFPHDENHAQAHADHESHDLDNKCTLILNDVNNKQPEDEDEEFEFAVVCKNPNNSLHVSADEIFFNGEIMPKYPLFDRSLLLNNEVNDVVLDKPDKICVSSESVRKPLGKLFREERETTSLEGDNLAGVVPGTYCIWKPKEELPEKCKKSNSTGNSSKRWRLRNFLQRSNSDSNSNSNSNMSTGKHVPVVDLGYFSSMKTKGEKVKKIDHTAKVAGADDDGEVGRVIEENNWSNKGGNRIRSYLQFKRDQIGVSANIHR